MPKRRNPFGEITPLQRKMHVGFEQMATQEERLAVFEKTKLLLFEAANGSAACATAPAAIRAYQNGGHQSIYRASSEVNRGCVETAHTRHGGQQHGLLSYFTSSRGVTGDSERLGGCERVKECKSEGVLCCDHCEGSVSVRECFNCHTSFCASCSVLNYDEADVRCFCLNCLPSCT